MMALNDYKGQAKAAFSRGKAPIQRTPYKGRNSEMVKAQAHGLQDGPKPPEPFYSAVKKQHFNQAWRKEYAEAQKQTERMIDAFKNAKGKKEKADIATEFTRNSDQEISM